MVGMKTTTVIVLPGHRHGDILDRRQLDLIKTRCEHGAQRRKHHGLVAVLDLRFLRQHALIDGPIGHRTQTGTREIRRWS